MAKVSASSHLNKTTAVDVDKYDMTDNIIEEEQESSNLDILPINPIVEKDNEIATLKEQLGSLKDKVSCIPELEQNIIEIQNENKKSKAIARQLSRRLSVSGRANEQKMVGLIKTGNNWTEDSAHIACSHAATLDEDEFSLEEGTNNVVPKNPEFNFLKKVEKYLDKDDKLQQERLEELRKLILHQMKVTILNKMELRGEKRAPDLDLTPTAQSKPRFISPPKADS